MAAPRKSPAAKSAGDTKAEQAIEYIKSLDYDQAYSLFIQTLADARDRSFDVRGDRVVLHEYGDAQLSLKVSGPAIDSFMKINAEASTWPEQVDAWKAEVIPADVLDAIDALADGDGVNVIDICTLWIKGLDVRLGKAHS